MKNKNVVFIVLFGLLISCNVTKKQEKKTTSNPVEYATSQKYNTFEIEKLSIPKGFISQESKKEYLKNQKHLSFGGEVIEKTSILPDSIISIGGENPFLNGMVTAYQDHRPFTISPDIIWILISQGFSHHISFNSEKYRDYFVNFQGKKSLKIDAKKI